MPEGPSLLILKEAILKFRGKKILEAWGNAKFEIPLLQKQVVRDIRTWGKQLFFVLDDNRYIRIHLLMFGSYEVNKQTKPDRTLRLALRFGNGRVFFYACSVKLIEGDLTKDYDWSADVMSDAWKPLRTKKKLKELKKTLVCDAMLDQQIFSGVGNIIKNEVLFRIRVHPETIVRKMPEKKISELVKESRRYSFEFLEWKKKFVLRKHWLVHTKKICVRCNIPLIKKYCGKTNRRTFFCSNCQIKY
jgi:endonuclease-8